MKAIEQSLALLLDPGNPPDYIRWNRKRIISCVEFLRNGLTLKGRRTLDLGHDVHVGSLLVHSGCDLRGNVAPTELNGPEQTRNNASYTDPEGKEHHWRLDAFDFEGSFPYPDATFDLVTAMEVIEHVSSSPRAFVKEIKRVLKPGGSIFIATPNAASWAKILRQLHHAPSYDSKPYSEDFGPRHVMCHVYEYTPWELKGLLRSEGFEIANFATWDPYESDPSGVRPWLLTVLFAGALVLLGYFRQAALLFKDRGHQIGLIATLKPS
jgi:SAM-dependent methyltransferase